MNYPQIFKFSVATSALCASAIGFTACSNSDESSGSSAKETALSVEVSGKTVGDTLMFDMMDSTYDLKIEADGKWRIEDETGFIQSISQDSGEGDATIQMRLTTNDWDDRYVGDLHIVFPEDTSLNKAITVVQKYSGDYEDNAGYTQTNKVYAVGYGYNAITGGYADYASLKCEIFDTERLAEEKGISFGSTNVSLKTTSVTGSTIADISFELGAKANISGSFGGFSAEMKSSFDMKKASESKYEYALTYLDLATQSVSTDIPLRLLRKEYMKRFAYNSINGLNKYYPTNNEGFKALIDEYGTHVVLGARLGGRIRQSMTADVSKITSKYDISVFAKAAYKGAFVKIDASVDTKMSQSFEENLSNLNIDVNVLGGDDKKALALSNSKVLNADDVNSWKESVIEEKGGSLIGFMDNGVVPLYELIDETISDSTAKRKNLLKEYMESKQIASDFDAYYECGTVTEIDVPKIEDLDNNTLIKDVYLGGQLVAKAALEFVPLLNLKEKVMVIYPVINNKARFNLGFYIGDKDHKPARVSWNGTDATIVEYENLDFGSAEKLYIRGASVTSVPPEGTEPHVGTVEDSYLASKIIDETGYADVDHNYPLVKIFDHIWIRQDYAGSITRKGLFRQPGSGDVFWSSAAPIWRRYDATEVEEYVPLGWKIPSDTVFKSIENEFKKSGLSNIGKAMLRKKDCDSEKECGLLGFSAVKWGDKDFNFYGTIKSGDKIGVVYIKYDASVFDFPYYDPSVVQLRIIQE